MRNILTILFLFGFYNSKATDYYVSAGGNDANSGISPAAAWRTIAKVNSFAFAAGSRILFNRGDSWHEQLIPHAGSSGNPVIYSAYGTGANPIINGLSTVSGWTFLGSNKWESTSPVSTLNSCNLVLIDGVNTPMGRYPNTGYFPYTSFTLTTKTSSSINSLVTNWTGAEAVIRKNNWIIDRDTITAHSGVAFSHTYHSSGTYPGIAGYGFFIQNDLRTLDAQNEWYYSPSTKKITTYSASSPGNIQLSNIDTLVYTKQRDYITFDGIDIIGSNKDAIVLGGSRNITIQNCTIDYHGKDAIWGAQNYGAGSGTNLLLSHCVINHINNDGICVDNEFTNAVVSHNTFKNIGKQVGMGGNGASNQGTYVGMSFTQSGLVQQNVLVEYNNLDSIGYSGITFFTSGIEVKNNFVNHACMVKIDGGGIYTWFMGAAGPRSNRINQKVHDNIVINCIGTTDGTTEAIPLAHGFYMDDGSGNIELYNNTSANNSYNGYFIHNDSVMNIHNNTAYNNGKYQAHITSYTTAEPLRQLIFKNNILFSRTNGQRTASWESGANDINLFGSPSTVDSNYYARPIDDNLTIQTVQNGSVFTQRTLFAWQTFFGYDAHSNKSPMAISDVNDLRFEYNATEIPATISLPYNYIDVKGTHYNGTITLAPYRSAVLIKFGAIIGGNIPPIAAAGSDQSITLPTTTATLAGDGFDSDGTIVSYLWTQISGPSSTITSPSTSGTSITGMSTAGTYAYQLEVTDNLGATGRDTVQIVINASNVSPVATAGVDQSFNLPVTSTTLSGSGTDPDGTISSYSWAQTAGPSASILSPSSASTSVSGLTATGTYTFTLTVTDNNGATNTDAVTIVVQDEIIVPHVPAQIWIFRKGKYLKEAQ